MHQVDFYRKSMKGGELLRLKASNLIISWSRLWVEEEIDIFVLGVSRLKNGIEGITSEMVENVGKSVWHTGFGIVLQSIYGGYIFKILE